MNILRFYPKDDGDWYFCSADVEKDIFAIKEYYRTKAMEKELSAAKREKEKAQRMAQRVQQSAASTRQGATRRKQSKIRYIFLTFLVIFLIILFTNISGIVKVLKNTFEFGDTSKNDKTNTLIQDEIDNFVSNFGNTHYLSIGENHKPQASVWLNGKDDDICYSTNEDIVTVTAGGIVKAMAAGEAFVVVRSGNMLKCTNT